MFFHGGVGRALFSVARCGKLPDEFRVADLDRLRRDYSRLAIDEDEKFYTHFIDRWPDMGVAGVGVQLHTARAIFAARVLHESRADGRGYPGDRLYPVANA